MSIGSIKNRLDISNRTNHQIEWPNVSGHLEIGSLGQRFRVQSLPDISRGLCCLIKTILFDN